MVQRSLLELEKNVAEMLKSMRELQITLSGQQGNTQEVLFASQVALKIVR